MRSHHTAACVESFARRRRRVISHGGSLDFQHGSRDLPVCVVLTAPPLPWAPRMAVLVYLKYDGPASLTQVRIYRRMNM